VAVRFVPRTPKPQPGREPAEISTPSLFVSQLARILESRYFSGAEGRSRFLRYVVERVLQNRQGELKEYIIGLEVFRRGEAFDPKTDSIVRVEARNLRAKLRDYYQGEGVRDPIRIELPKGGYIPAFQQISERPPVASRHRAWPWFALATALLVIAAGLVYRLVGKYWSGSPRVESVAVLPFSNASENTEDEYLSDGLTAELITILTKRGRPRVVGSTSVFQLKGQPLDVRRAGAELGADAVVQGRIRKSGDRLMVTAELIAVSNGRHLWMRTYEREWRDVWGVQQQIADDVAAALGTAPVAAVSHTQNTCSENLAAYELYLRGTRAEVARGLDDMTRSVDYFSRAAALEPRCAPIYAHLGILYVREGVYGIKPPWEAMPRAKDAARRAIDIDETLPLGHVALGAAMALYDWDWKSAERELRIAVQLNPESTEAHEWFSHYVLVPQRRFDEALVEVHRAKWLDPASPFLNGAESEALYFAGRYDAAIAQARQLVERRPDFGFGYLYMAWSFEQKRMFADASSALSNAMRLDKGNLLPQLELAVLEGMQGRTERARNMLREFQRRSKTGYVPAPTFAHIYCILGEKEEALHWLARGRDERSPMMAYLDVARDYDNLRTDARFEALLRDVHLK
jgi:TolB-like protein/lipoprotein NlpI